MAKYLLLILLSAIGISSQAQNINLYPDSAHAPFIYGVASGDPTTSRVMLWTAVKADTSIQTYAISWQLATDSTFAQLVDSGQHTIDSTTGFTFKVDVDGLTPNTHYCYRFRYDTVWSITGFTLTAPDSAQDSLKFVIASCSSLFSGYFNAYRQIARIPHLNAVVHLGDFIYDYVDPQERVRIPQPEPANPVTLNDWRKRYALYCLDPDQREARRRHPWIQIWDNHDVNPGGSSKREQAFLEATATREPDSSDISREWRELKYGNLVDIIMIDMNTFPNVDLFPSGAPMIMKRTEYQWLLDRLDSSTSKWKLIGNGKMFSPWNLGSFASLVPGGLNRTWNGYPENRDSLLANIERNHINNVVIVSGDEHMNISSDLTRNPYDSSKYNPRTGLGALGVEMMGTSITRGNLNEAGVPISNAPTFNALSLDSNPHEVYTNFFDHGYCVMTFRADSMTAAQYLCPILALSDSQNLETTLICKTDQNHWVHPPRLVGISDIEAQSSITLYPNPVDGWLHIKMPNTMSTQIEVFNVLGERVMTCINNLDLDTHSLHSGVYVTRIRQGDQTYVARFVKQ